MYVLSSLNCIIKTYFYPNMCYISKYECHGRKCKRNTELCQSKQFLQKLLNNKALIRSVKFILLTSYYLGSKEFNCNNYNLVRENLIRIHV